MLSISGDIRSVTIELGLVEGVDITGGLMKYLRKTEGGGIVALLTAIIFLPVLILVACPGDEYSLEQFHSGDLLPWMSHFEGFRNLCTSSICPSGDSACIENGTFDTFELHVEDAAHARDRFLFFEACESCSSTDDAIDGGATEFRVNGAYGQYEGRGEARLTNPVWTSHHGPPVPTGLVRRYQRGSCSFEASLSQSILLQRPGEELERKLEHEDSFLSFGSFRVDIVEAQGQVLIGAESCAWDGSENRDFISLRYVANVEPVWGKGDFTLELNLHWRFVSQERYLYLGCTGNSCRRRESETSCDDDDDCAGIPGAHCDHDVVQGQGVCVNSHALDVADYSFEATLLESNCENSACRWRRREMLRLLADTSEDAYRQIYAPVLNNITEEYYWQDVPVSYQPVDSCTSDDQCSQLLIMEMYNDVSDYDLFGRCGPGNRCQVRPNFIYGANTYPDGLEIVLTREGEDINLTGLLRLLDIQEEDPSNRP